MKKYRDNFVFVIVKDRGTGETRVIKKVRRVNLELWLEKSVDIFPTFQFTIDVLRITKAATGGRSSTISPTLRRVDLKSELLSDEAIVRCLNDFGASMDIVAGEFNDRVYTERFRSTLNRQLDIAAATIGVSRGYLACGARIICGPVVVVSDTTTPDDLWSGTVLPDLADEKDVQVFYSEKRQRRHFRLVRDAVYFESRHAPHTPERVGYASFHNLKALKTYGDEVAKLLDNGTVHLCDTANAVKAKFEVLTATQLRYVSTKVDMNDMTLDQLRPLIDGAKKALSG